MVFVGSAPRETRYRDFGGSWNWEGKKENTRVNLDDNDVKRAIRKYSTINLTTVHKERDYKCLN